MKLNLHSFFNVYLLSLPFTQAFTISVGFPLKVSEILLILFLFLYFLQSKVKWDLTNSIISVLVGLFFILSCISFLVNINWGYSYVPKLLDTRLSRELDSMLKLFYYFLDIIAFYFSLQFLKNHLISLRYWLYGAFISCILAWILYLLSGYLHIDIHLPGMMDIPQKSDDGFIRCGTFKEGNFFGLYLVMSTAIALMMKKPIWALFFILTSITSRSTTTYIALFFLIIVFYRDKIFKWQYLFVAIVTIIPILFYWQTIYESTFFKKNILDKISNESYYITSTGQISKIDRSNQADIAYRLGADNLYFGVGPGNYKFHYDKYNEVFGKYFMSDENIKTFAYYKTATIPNNVYLEVFSELGIFAFVAFLAIIFFFLLKSFQAKQSALFAGAIAVIIYFNSYPTLSLLFIWTFLAIPFVIEKNKKWS
jgi:hypothetical protein